MTIVPLHEAVRPTGNRDHAGELGENLHALADDIETNAPQLIVEVGDTTSADPEYWQSVIDGLQRIRSINRELFGPAISRIIKLAKAG